MPRFPKGSVNNNWQKSEDGPVGTIARPEPPRISDAELMRRYANVRNNLREFGIRSEAALKRLEELRTELAARGIDEIPESCAGPRPTLAQVLRTAQRELAGDAVQITTTAS